MKMRAMSCWCNKHTSNEVGRNKECHGFDKTMKLNVEEFEQGRVLECAKVAQTSSSLECSMEGLDSSNELNEKVLYIQITKRTV